MVQLNISYPPSTNNQDFDSWLQQTVEYLRDYLGLYDESAQVAFTADGTGAVARTVEGKLQSGQLDPYDFGCSAGTAADQATNFQKALDAASTYKLPLDLCGQTWRIDSTLTMSSDVELRNGTIDFSNAAADDQLFNIYGTFGSGTGLTACGRGATSLTVADATGLAAGDILYLRSTDTFGLSGTHKGEFVRIKTVVGTTVTPYERTRDNYVTDPEFYKPTLVRNVRLKNLRLIGGGDADDHEGVLFYLARDCHVENVVSEYFGERHVQFNRCLDCTVSNSKFSHSDDATGLSYGVAIVNGCLRIAVTNSTFRDERHGVTIGGVDGVSRFITAHGNTCTDCTDAGLDSHPSAEFVAFTGNTISADSNVDSANGIVAQCASATIVGNVVTGFSGIGILLQDLGQTTTHKDAPHVIAGNSVSSQQGEGDSYGIFVENQRVGDAMRVVISGNCIDIAEIDDSRGIYVSIHADGSTIYGLSITGNTVYSNRAALTLYTAASKLMTRIAITGNVLETIDTATYNCLNIASTTANYITRAIIAGNSIYGGVYGIDNSNGQRIKADANMIQAFGTGATNGTIVGTNDNYSS